MVQVVNVAGRDEREAGLLGELRELWVDPRLLLESGVLDLDLDVFPAENLGQGGGGWGRGVGGRPSGGPPRGRGRRDPRGSRRAPRAPGRATPGAASPRAACSS